jgi:hypothetical protein
VRPGKSCRLAESTRYIEWTFGAPKEETADELLNCIRTYGCPAMESLASREAVIDALKERQNRGPTSLFYRHYKLPVAYLLHGDRDSALREIHDELVSMSERTDEEAKFYRLFCQKFEGRAEVRSESR